MRTSLSIPQYDEHHWAVDKNDFPFNINSIKYKSPTLPLHFDKKYLPKNLCEKQILNASQCLLLQNINESEKGQMCKFELSHFEICRRSRDMRIIQAIKQWQTQHFQKLDSKNKGFYNMGLNRKLDRLKEELERQPSTIKGIETAKILELEIKEIKWRLGYINKLQQAVS